MNALAKLSSWVLHPLLIPTYMLLILLMVNPFLFGANSVWEQPSIMAFLQIFFNTFLIPAIAVVMMRFLGFVSSMQMPDRQERIGPYLVTGLLYLWVYRSLAYTDEFPTVLTSFMLGATLSLFFAFFINLFSKISAHAVGMGGLLMMLILASWQFSYDAFTLHLGPLGTFQVSMLALVLGALLLCGWVGTARLYLRAHEPVDLYGGFIVGIAGQLLAFRWVFM